MNLRNISAWSIGNPVVPIVLFLFLTLSGVIAFMKMDVVNQPNIELPFVTVAISQPGAAPTELENQVTQRVEAAVRGVNGVEEITSNVSEGLSFTFVQFAMGTDANAATNEVKSQVDQIRSSLPAGILEPQIAKADTASMPIATFSIYAPDKTAEQASWFIDDTVARELLALPGVSKVTRQGGVNREIRVVLDPARMRALGVTASQINRLIAANNLNTGGGLAEIAGSRQAVRIMGNTRSAVDLANLVIPVSAAGTVRLGDVADVVDGTSEASEFSSVDGKESINFAVSRTKASSDLTVFEVVDAALKKIEAKNPGVRFHVVDDSLVTQTKSMFHSSMESLLEGAALAVVIVFLFLRDWRATLISAIAIPLSAIPTFWFLDLLGFNINQMVMLALSLVAGVLVDDAIVEIENIVRHMRMGKSAYQASIEAADEIGLAVVATTFSIVAVFFPVAMMPGIIGQYFKNFGYTVVASVLMSLAVARMVTPMIAAYFLKAHGEREHGGGPVMAAYLRVLGWTMRHRILTVFFGLLSLGLTFFLLVATPSQDQPNMNENAVGISYTLVPGTTLADSRAIGESIAGIMRRQPEVEEIQIFSSIGKGEVGVNLKRKRDTTSDAFKRRMNPQLQQIADAQIQFRDNDGGGGASSGRPISVMLMGSDSELLDRTAEKVVAEMRGLSEIVAPRVASNLQRPELQIVPRRELIAALGISTSALGDAIRVATQGEIDQLAAKYSLSDRQIPIRVILSEASRSDLSIIENIPVPTATGGTVPLSRVADIRFGSGVTTISRYNQSRRVFIGADLAPGVVKGDAMKKINALPTMKNLPAGVTNTLTGFNKMMQEFYGDFLQAIVTGIFLVFAVLVLLYHRFIAPLVNMLSLLLAPLGGLLLLNLVGMPTSIPVWIGILMLIGIVGKNSILLIDYAIEEMAAGVSKQTAIIDAGRKRAQPIVMTTVAMVAGMVPTALSLSGDGSWAQPMGVTVIGGLTVSTILTLLIVPAGFSLADGAEKRLSRWLGPKLIAGGPAQGSEHASRIHGGLPASASD